MQDNTKITLTAYFSECMGEPAHQLVLEEESSWGEDALSHLQDLLRNYACSNPDHLRKRIQWLENRRLALTEEIEEQEQRLKELQELFQAQKDKLKEKGLSESDLQFFDIPF